MTELEALKRKNDVSRFISLLDDTAIEKIENFMISENFQVADENKETLSESSIGELLNFDPEILTEDTQNKIKVIFEAAVTQKVDQELNTQLGILQEKVDTFINENQGKVDEYAEYVKAELEKEYDAKVEALNEQIDEYLDYVANEWITDNKLVIEEGIKTQISENVINGLKTLFEENYIDVPTEKLNLISDLEQKVSTLLESNVRLNSQIREKNDQIVSLKKGQVFELVTEGLTSLEKDKLNELANGIKVSSLEDYKAKLSILKESVVAKAKPKTNTLLTEETVFSQPITTQEVDPRIQGYLNIYSKKR